MRIILLILGILAVPAVMGDVYRSVDEDGNIVYSDKSSPDAEKVEIQEVQTIDPGAVPEFESSTNKQDPSAGDYQGITISSPANDQTISANDGNVNVSVSVQPALKEGDTIELYLNGGLAGSSKGGFNLENLDRGSHTISAVLKDKDGKEILHSEPITFHVQRHSVKHKKSTVGKPPAPAPTKKPATASP